MLTRVLFALALICGLAGVAAAARNKVVALGLADHEVTERSWRRARRRLRRTSTPRRWPMCWPPS